MTVIMTLLEFLWQPVCYSFPCDALHTGTVCAKCEVREQ